MASHRKPQKTFKPEYVRQAYIACVDLGATDEDLAAFFGVDIGTLALWAWNHEAFYNAITPTPEDIASTKREQERKNKGVCQWVH